MRVCQRQLAYFVQFTKNQTLTQKWRLNCWISGYATASSESWRSKSCTPLLCPVPVTKWPRLKKLQQTKQTCCREFFQSLCRETAGCPVWTAEPWFHQSLDVYSGRGAACRESVDVSRRCNGRQLERRCRALSSKLELAMSAMYTVCTKWVQKVYTLSTNSVHIEYTECTQQLHTAYTEYIQRNA